MDGWIGEWVDGWINRQMAFGIQIVYSPDDLSDDKSSHFLEFRINSSPLPLTSL